MYLRRSLGTLGSLILLACLVQAWTVDRAVVPAQDSIRYLTVAQAMGRDGLVAAVRTQPEQPLFPALVWLTHSVLTASGLGSPGEWALSLQLAAAVPLVLSVAPVFLLFRRLHGQRAAVIGALLYGVLGGIARLGADGLSDSTHLLFFCVALWTAVEYFARLGVTRARGLTSHKVSYRPAAWLFASGICTGLALLTRAEAAVLPVALLASVVGFQAIAAWRQPWVAALRAAGATMLGLALTLGPYLAVCQSRDFGSIAARLLGRRGAIESLALNDLSPARNQGGVEPRWHLPGVGQLVFGKKDVSTTSRFRGYLAATAKLGRELAQTLHYVIGALALAGLWSSRRRLNTPLDRFLQLLCGGLLLAAVSVAAGGGYLSTRHLLLLVVLALGWAGAGVMAVGDWLAERLPVVNVKTGRKILSGSLAALALATCTGDLLRPLHASRAGHRTAANWLNAHAAANDAVLDSRGWTALYTGRKTYRYEAAQLAFCDVALRYVVVEQAELEANSRRGETLRLLVAQAGEPAAHFAPARAAKHGVTVWRWFPERFAQLGVDADAR